MPAHVSSTVKKNTVMLRQEHGNPLCAKNDVLRIYRLEIPCCQRKTLQNKLQTILYLVCDTCPAKYKSIGIQYCMLHGFCGGNSIYSTHRSDLLRSAHIRQIRSDHQIRADQIRSSDNLTSDRSDQIIRSYSHTFFGADRPLTHTSPTI